MGKYAVELERDESGWWVATVRHVAGVHTQGRSIDEVMRRVREALSLERDDAESAKLDPYIKLPAEARSQVRSFEAIKRKVNDYQQKMGMASRETVNYLTEELGLSVRDVGKLLGLSHARVQQLKEA